jgi:hypothetical protein
MIIRRKLMLASLAGVVLPLCAVLAQPAPDDGRGPPAGDHGPDRSVGVSHAPAPRPRMPPPRHEVRPRPPSPTGYRWQSGRWNWNGRQWAWTSGRWSR